MQRFKINFPEDILYKTKLTIQPEDINYAGHLGNERLLVFASDVKQAFFASYDYEDVYGGGNEGTIIASNLIVYKSEAFEGEELIVEVAIERLNEVSFDLLFRFTASLDNRLVGYVQAGTVYYDYENRCIKEIPEILLHILQKGENE